jgi:D-alanyl-D-alanine dipeptidase
MPDYTQRLRAVQERMAAGKIDLLFLPHSANLHYVTGIAREEHNYGNTMYPGDWMTGAWIPQAGAPILTIPRMMAEFHGSISGYDVRVLPDVGDALATVRDVWNWFQLSFRATVAIEDRARAETVLKVQSLFPEVKFKPASDIMMPLRMIKDADEIAILRKAGEITEAAYQAVLGKLRYSMTNLDLITEVNFQLKRHGSLAPSFTTSFYNMGKDFPFDFHNREAVMLIPLDPPVSVSFDFGSVYDGYCYDFGRSVFFGEPDAEYRRAYDLVIASQTAGVAALKAGDTCEQADTAARKVIEDGGYGYAFRHRLGHGIGMDVHEPPFLTKGNTTVMQPGMCFTVEPSIFIPHQFGARVEDIVVVGVNGGEPLTNGYKKLHVVA